MAKKFGKFLLFSIFAGAAAAGTYYFLKDRNEEDYFEDSEPDVNDELEEFLKKESAKGPDNAASREYVPLNFSKEAVKDAADDIPEAIKESASEVADHITNAVSDAATDNVAETVNDTAEAVHAQAVSAAGNIEVTLEDTAEKVSEESENIIGKPIEEMKNPVEKASDTERSNISTFSFSSFE